MAKHLVLTGASSGIGRELAKLAQAQGYVLSLCGRSEEKLATTMSQLPNDNNVYHEHFCLTDAQAREAFFNHAVAANGPIDILINCAGLNNVRQSGEATQIEQLDWLMQVNCYVPIACMQAVLPRMREQGQGAIVNVLSTVCLYANPGIAAYTASKSALDAYTKVMRKELLGSHIKMLSVYPGGVDTDFREADRPNYLTAEDVAKAIMGQLDTTASAHIHELVIRPESESNFV